MSNREGRLTSAVQRGKHANQLFATGLKLMKMENYVDALDCLAQCLEIRVKYYGDLAIECAPAYYQYGRALYYKLLQDSHLLCGNDGESELDQADGDDNDDNHELEVSPEESSSDGMDEAPCESGDEDCEAPDAVCNQEKPDGEQQDCVGDEDIEIEKEEADFELARKMLDIARVIYEGQQFDYSSRRVEVLTALGDVALEREEFHTAWNDYSTAICILEGNAKSNDRYVAELYYKLSVTLQCWDKLAAAVNYIRLAVSILESCLRRLTNELRFRDGKRIFEGNYTNSSEVAKMSREEVLAEMGTVTQRLVAFREKVGEVLQMVSEREENPPKVACVSPVSIQGSKRSCREIDLGVFGRRKKRIAVGVNRGTVVRL